MNNQFLCILPMLIVIILSIILKDVFISILAGVICGLVVINTGHPDLIIQGFIDILYDVLMSKDTIWVILICLFFGALNKIIKESGGVEGIEKYIQHFCKTRQSTMLGTWILGLLICMSEYLSALIVGLTFQKVNDQHKVSREMFAYIINSTCATVCSIIPISDMAVFMSGLMKNAGLINGNNLMNDYFHTIPFILYSFLAILIVPLFIFNIIPLYGTMKKAENKALKNRNDSIKTNQYQENKQAKIYNFFIPIICLFIFTILMHDILISLFITLLLSFVLYIIQGVFSVKDFFNAFIEGMLDIFPICITIVLAYMLVVINRELGMIEFISKIILQAIPVL